MKRHSWYRRLWLADPQPTRRLAYRPRLEALEDRTLLSTLVLDPKNIIVSSAANGDLPQVDLINPASSGGSFGAQIVSLSSGNVVVTDPTVNNDAGAVYLFNGRSGALISALSGSTGGNTGDQVGSGGITVLTNGNYVISSPLWDGHQGAVTWGSGTAGVSGTISASNSLIDTGAVTAMSPGIDNYSDAVVTALTNGNYVVSNAYLLTGRGTVTWGSGTTGVAGTISAANSIIGTTAGAWQTSSSDSSDASLVGGDRIGLGGASTLGAFGVFGGQGAGITALTNGNYVIASPAWNNGTGAVTLATGTTALTGTVSAANSLVGSPLSSGFEGDYIGSGGITTLTNGNYVVLSPYWHGSVNDGIGAVTWCSGTTELLGTVSAANSLVGSTPGELSGYNRPPGTGMSEKGATVTALTNGNYVVADTLWNDNTGAVAWGNGFIGTAGVISAANSLVGTTASAYTGDLVGSGGVTALANGNYVVGSPFWNDNQGAATWCNGSAPTIATVSAANSFVGGGSVTALTNGNYVVATGIGATWANGSVGLVGTASAANSLAGSVDTITALTNGNYVVVSSNGSLGAVTWGNGNTGTIGTVSAANSLVGTATDDNVGEGGVVALSNGNYVVLSPSWSNGLGAVTWGSGTGSTVGPVSAAKSLIGTTPSGFGVGSSGVIALPNGDYVVLSQESSGVPGVATGAATWASGTSGATLDGQSTIDPANSFIAAAAAYLDIPSSTNPMTAVPGPDPGTFFANFTTLNGNGGQVFGGVPLQGPLTFAALPDLTLSVSPAYLTNALDAGTNVVLQANNDITVSSPITVTPTAAAGNLTLDAGRTILLGASIATGGGNLSLIANDTVAEGVVDADRDPGNANIDLLTGATLNTGSGTVSMDVKDSTDKTNNGQGAAVLTNLNPASTTLSPTTALGFILNGTTPGDGVAAETYTQLNVTGPLDLNGIALQLTHAPTGATAGETFTIVQTTGGITGTFNGLAEGATVTAQDGTEFTISYLANGGDDVTLTAVTPPGFSYDSTSQVLTITGSAATNTFTYSQGSAVDGSGTLQTTCDFTLNGATIAYPQSQLSRVNVNAQGANNLAVLITNDTYVGSDGLTHETLEDVVLGPGGGSLNKPNAAGTFQVFLILNGFSTSYAYVGHADTAELVGVQDPRNLQNTFVTAGSYSYIFGDGEFHLVSGAKYVYGYESDPADQAWQYDAAGSLDAFVASGNAYSYMSGSDTNGNTFFNEAVGFQVTYGIATHGNAIAYLLDSPGNDVFFGSTTYSYLSGTDSTGSVFNVAEAFSLVYGESFVGGTDFAYNYDPTHNILNSRWILLT